MSGVGHDHGHPSHYSTSPYTNIDPHFALSDVNERSSTSPAFAPHTFVHGGGLHSPGLGNASSRPAIFNDAVFGRIDSVTLGSASPGFGLRVEPLLGGNGIAVRREDEVNRMFEEMTNHDEELGAGANGVDIPKRDDDRDRDREKDTKWNEDDEIELFFDQGP